MCRSFPEYKVEESRCSKISDNHFGAFHFKREKVPASSTRNAYGISNAYLKTTFYSFVTMKQVPKLNKNSFP